MKIALACDSLLLTKSLEIFLKKNLTSYKRCDFVISDKKIEINKPLFLISDKMSNLQVPFSESSLMIELDRFYTNLISDKTSRKESSKIISAEIREKIDFLTKKFRDDLIEVMQEYYEKR
ncbi:MAG: hypothetical protein QM482_01650 [Sulfurospirillum sp.]